MTSSRLAGATVPFVLALISATCSAAQAENARAPATPVLPPVEVSALRDPVEKSYRDVVRGMDLFERRHSLAPDASLRFRLLPRTRVTNMQDITITIVSDNLAVAVPLAPDNTFSLSRVQQALDDDALVVPNRTVGSMTWRTDIRTPGLPADTRRLGDLRLECIVGEEAGLISNSLPFFGRIARLLGDRNYCERSDAQYLFFTDRALFSVTLVAGSRTEVLPVEKLYGGISRHPMAQADLHYCDCEVLVDRTYYAPLGDPGWPDDTLLHFEYMDDVPRGAPASLSPGTGTP